MIECIVSFSLIFLVTFLNSLMFCFFMKTPVMKKDECNLSAATLDITVASQYKQLALYFTQELTSALDTASSLPRKMHYMGIKPLVTSFDEFSLPLVYSSVDVDSSIQERSLQKTISSPTIIIPLYNLDNLFFESILYQEKKATQASLLSLPVLMGLPNEKLSTPMDLIPRWLLADRKPQRAYEIAAEELSLAADFVVLGLLERIATNSEKLLYQLPAYQPTL